MNFVFSIFSSRYAIGSDRGRPQTVPFEEVDAPFSEYVKQHLTFAQRLLPKDQSPGIIHGKTNGYRGAKDVLSCTALVLDCDAATKPPYEIIESLTGAYLCQWRKVDDVIKWHLVLPLVRPLEPHEIHARREAAVRHFAETYGVALDHSVTWPASMLHPYCRRTDGDPVPTTWSGDGAFFDLDTLPGQEWVRPVKVPPQPPRQRSGEYDTVAEAIDAAGLFLDVPARPRGRPMRCPYNHSGQGPSSTIFSDDGRIICLHDGCRGRTQAEFLAQLPLRSTHTSPAMRAQLSPRPGAETTVEAAQDAMRGGLAAVRPFRR